MSDKIQRKYIKKGIHKIKDVIDRNCKFKTMEEITGEFQVDNMHGLSINNSLNPSVMETKNTKIQKTTIWRNIQI